MVVARLVTPSALTAVHKYSCCSFCFPGLFPKIEFVTGTKKGTIAANTAALAALASSATSTTATGEDSRGTPTDTKALERGDLHRREEPRAP